jgi:hypothetical protein
VAQEAREARSRDSPHRSARWDLPRRRAKRILAHMASKHWAWVAALAVLVAGITNAHAHVHLCFDGHDPPAAVYLAEAADHDHSLDEDVACSGDVDIDLQNQALAKTVKHDLLAIEPLIAWTLAFEPHAACPLPVSARARPVPAPPYTHPPLRAPPR